MNPETFTLVNGIFVLGLGIALLLLYLNKKTQPRKIAKDKEEPYTGGETIREEDLQQSPEAIFWPIRRAFKPFYKSIAKKHTGNLSDYLAWVLLALVLITLSILGVALL